jgi:4-amino-4-deoxy-L-arabinose transferase-like glycosyltransferase
VALAARGAFQASYVRSLPFQDWQNPNLDGHTFHLWAERIARGDLLSRDVPHPHHAWSRSIATPDEWEAWYGKETFHQAPLYPYLVALVYAVVGVDPGWVHALQALLGALVVVLVFLATRDLFGKSAAIVAALLLAFHAPLLLYEMTLLREVLLTLLSALMLVALLRARRWRSSASALILGLVLGLSFLAKPTGLVFLPLAVAVLFRARRQDPTGNGGHREESTARSTSTSSPETTPVTTSPGATSAGRALALLALGAVLPLLPAIARNLAVGASPLKITTRGPEVFLAGNAHGSSGVGWFPDDTRAVLLEGHARTILQETHGRLLPTAIATLRTHPSIGSYLDLILRKACALLSPLEIPNNVNFYEVREKVPLLRWVGFVPTGVMLPLALAGVLLALLQRPRPWILLACLLLGSTAVLAGFIVSRFRLPLLPFAAPFAGLAVVSIVVLLREAVTARSSRAALGLGGIALLITGAALFPRLRPVPYRVPTRPQALLSLAGHLHAASLVDDADALYREAEEAARQGDEPGVALESLRRRALLHLAAGNPGRAVPLLEEWLDTVERERWAMGAAQVAGVRGLLEKARRRPEAADGDRD